MPTRSTDKEDFLGIVQNTLLSWLRQDKIFTILAQPPLRAPRQIQITPSSEPLLKVKRGRRASSNLVAWPHLNLEAKPNPFFAFVLKGCVDVSVGVTELMAVEAGRHARQGMFHLRLPQQSLIVYPSFVPHPDGRKPHWEGDINEQPDSTILWVDIISEGALLHTCHSVGGAHMHGSTRFVFDSRLPMLLDWYIEELQADSLHSAERANRTSLTRPMLEMLLLRIGRSLSQQEDLTISTRVLARNAGEAGLAETAPYHTSLASSVKRACIFIRGALNQQLTVDKVCRHVMVSSTQLNRLFRAELGLSIMEYVNQQRLEMAKSLLVNTTLPVNVISRNVGLRNAVYFSRIFRQKTDKTPLQYRAENTTK